MEAACVHQILIDIDIVLIFKQRAKRRGMCHVRARQYFYQLEFASPSMLGRSGEDIVALNTATVEQTFTFPVCTV